MSEHLPQAEAALLQTVSDTDLFKKRINQLIEFEQRLSDKIAKYNHIANIAEAEEKAERRLIEIDRLEAKVLADGKQKESEVRTWQKKLAEENRVMSDTLDRQQRELLRGISELAAEKNVLRLQREQLQRDIAECAREREHFQAQAAETSAERNRLMELRRSAIEYLSNLEK